MTKMKFIVTLFIVLSSTAVVSQNNIMDAFNKIKGEKVLENASISFRVIDLDTDTAIAEYNPYNSLVPASTMKIVSTSAALVSLGSYTSFKTTLQYDGVIDSNGVLLGNIYIKGGGDPTLGSNYFLNKDENASDFMLKWVLEIQKLGIKEIKGAVIGDASHFSYEGVPSTWLWGDMGNYYGAGTSGLTIYDNLTYLTFRSGLLAGDSTFIDCVTPCLPNQKFNNQVKAADSKKDNAYVYSAPYSNLRLIKGSIPKGRDDFNVKASMTDPAYQAAWDLEYYLLNAGIKIQLGATTKRKLELAGMKIEENRANFYTQKSPSIARIVYKTNHVSNNLYAEHLLNAVGKKINNAGSNSGGTLAVKIFWSKRINTTGMYISDGSGMSRMNAVSAYHLTSILRYMKKSKNYKSFYTSLPIAGKSGTMTRIGRKTYASGRLRAKSGTMTRVKSYAGYVKSKSGKNLAFAIIVNNYNCYNSTMTKKLEKIMVAIANH
ncbi:MAG: D-alanyl-D-alanine carboxypeptidase/D-alanyl-D-alanine-endopeptidase (penicillin-binding protein 4) [Flavobacteriales bacterium]|jgi:D-alanyl-D-alanine carboxypeptidase/D-alanyl-D-alanine-endopeptidase (penicillin-binding protein 4)